MVYECWFEDEGLVTPRQRRPRSCAPILRGNYLVRYPELNLNAGLVSLRCFTVTRLAYCLFTLEPEGLWYSDHSGDASVYNSLQC